MSDIIASSRIRIARNINGYNFPSHLVELEQANDILKAVYNVLENRYDLEFKKLSNMSKTQSMMLLEENCISKDLLDNKDISAVAFNSDYSISIMFNEEDHIREQCIMKGFNLQKCFETIEKIDYLFINNLDIAFDKNLGFLTSCPTNVGTGLRASVMMFLPALTLSGKINELIHQLEHQSITVRGNYGEGSNANGYYYQISNAETIGKSELEIIKNVENHVLQIEQLEKQMQNNIMKNQPNILKNWVFRAVGIFKYSYMISTEEFFENIAKLKLGNNLGLLDIDDKIIADLEVKCCSAHLINSFGELSQEERDMKRAEYIRKKLTY